MPTGENAKVWLASVTKYLETVQMANPAKPTAISAISVNRPNLKSKKQEIRKRQNVKERRNRRDKVRQGRKQGSN